MDKELIETSYQSEPKEKIQLELGYIYIVHTKAYVSWQIGMYVGYDNIGRYSFVRTDATKFYIEAGEADFEKVLTHRNLTSMNLVLEDDV